MIEKLIYNSRTTEVDAATTRMVGAYEKTSLNSDVFLAELFIQIKAVLAFFAAAIKRKKAESNLEEKDEVRDDALRGLYYMLLGYLHNPAQAIREAAQKLEKVFGHYGISITGESYATESSLINSMLEDLAKPKLQDAIAILPGCAEQIAALQTAQDDFEAARITYEEEKASESTEKNATELKKEVLILVNDKLVVYLRAMVQVDDATYGKFTRTVGEIIADSNEVVKRRRAKPEPEETI